MLQFTYKLKITERVKGKCDRHPRYNPEKDGRAGIRGACSCCFFLYDLHQARIALDAAQREFIRRAAPWRRVTQSGRERAPSTEKELAIGSLGSTQTGSSISSVPEFMRRESTEDAGCPPRVDTPPP